MKASIASDLAVLIERTDNPEQLIPVVGAYNMLDGTRESVKVLVSALKEVETPFDSKAENALDAALHWCFGALALLTRREREREAFRLDQRAHVRGI